MRSFLDHIDFNVRTASIGFYRALFLALGWTLHVDGADIVSVGDAHGMRLCFLSDTLKDVANDPDGPGMNHLAIGVDSVADVDAMVAYFRTQGTELLFDTPRHRPEFADGADHTYYQAMVAAPDGMLFEIVYRGPSPAPR